MHTWIKFNYINVVVCSRCSVSYELGYQDPKTCDEFLAERVAEVLAGHYVIDWEKLQCLVT